MDTALGNGHDAILGYELHIIRSDGWTTASDAPIEYNEWIAFARADDQLVEAGVLSLRDTKPSEQPVFSFRDGPSIHWWRGQLVVSGADDTNVGLLLAIAQTLGARVQGDDGEFYD